MSTRSPFTRGISLLALFGLDLRRFVASLSGLKVYLHNRALLTKQMTSRGSANGDFPISRAHPCLTDRRAQSGVTRGGRAYFHQDLLVAQMIYASKPQLHLDVGSRVDGFVAHVASFRPVEVLDIRPAEIVAENITFKQLDLMEERPDLFECTDSLSCLHVLEHFGLGRYGDAVDYDGYKKGWENLYKMLKSNGKLYFSVPIGPQRIEFDAHRIFSVPFLLNMIQPKYRIDSFSYVDDEGVLVRKADVKSSEAKEEFRLPTWLWDF